MKRINTTIIPFLLGLSFLLSCSNPVQQSLDETSKILKDQPNMIFLTKYSNGDPAPYSYVVIYDRGIEIANYDTDLNGYWFAWGLNPHTQNYTARAWNGMYEGETTFYFEQYSKIVVTIYLGLQ